ncbi:MAG: hypothetical protein ACETVQ_00375, partial [Candidatus Bathyarchaeia archaeon]
QPSARPIEGLRLELAPFRGPLAPRLDPPPKETEHLQRYKSLQFTVRGYLTNLLPFLSHIFLGVLSTMRLNIF